MSTLNKIKVAKASDLHDEGVIRVAVDGMGDLAIYQLGDKYYATENLCTHGEASLAEGEVMDGRIYCPLHGGSFDIRTGKAADSPCVIDLYAYSVEVEGDDLIVVVEG